jgi:hypothetical protein
MASWGKAAQQLKRREWPFRAHCHLDAVAQKMLLHRVADSRIVSIQSMEGSSHCTCCLVLQLTTSGHCTGQGSALAAAASQWEVCQLVRCNLTLDIGNGMFVHNVRFAF